MSGTNPLDADHQRISATLEFWRAERVRLIADMAAYGAGAKQVREMTLGEWVDVTDGDLQAKEALREHVDEVIGFLERLLTL